MGKLNIIISCAGKQAPLVQAFKDALKNQGKVIVLDADEFASAKAVADNSIKSPEYKEKFYPDWCLKVCEDYKVGLWISLVEYELLILEEIRDKLKELGCVLIGAPVEKINNALDKRKYASFLNPFGINVPDTKTLAETKNTQELKEGKYIIKERKGRGSRGIIRVENLGELLEVARQKSYSENWVVQPIINGEIFCIDIINDLNGKYITTLSRRRLKMGHQETDVAETIVDEEINELSKRISAAIAHQGSIDVDVVRSGDELFVIDLNLRFGGSHIFSLIAGANIPAAIIAWRKGEDPDPEWLTHKEGMLAARYSTVVPFKTDNN